jgi:hypothetical protein
MNIKKRLSRLIGLFGLLNIATVQGGSASTPLGVICNRDVGCTASISVDVRTQVATVPFTCPGQSLLPGRAAFTNICNPVLQEVNNDSFIYVLPKCDPSKRATFKITFSGTPSSGLRCSIDPNNTYDQYRPFSRSGLQ